MGLYLHAEHFAMQQVYSRSLKELLDIVNHMRKRTFPASLITRL